MRLLSTLMTEGAFGAAFAFFAIFGFAGAAAAGRGDAGAGAAAGAGGAAAGAGAGTAAGAAAGAGGVAACAVLVPVAAHAHTGPSPIKKTTPRIKDFIISAPSSRTSLYLLVKGASLIDRPKSDRSSQVCLIAWSSNPRILPLRGLAAVILLSGNIRAALGQPAQPIAVPPLAIALEGLAYSYPVSFLDLMIEGQRLRMAYMDVKPTSTASRKSALLLHGESFSGITGRVSPKHSPPTVRPHASSAVASMWRAAGR